MEGQDAAIADLQFAVEVMKQILEPVRDADLSNRISDDLGTRTIREGLAQLIGWQNYALRVIPVMVAELEVDLPPVDVAEQNRRAFEARRNASKSDLLAEFDQNHRALIDLLSGIAMEELVLRRTRRGQTFTIRSYVIDLLHDEILRYVEDLKIWQESQQITPSE